jgi:serine phosphatase RsbU (regulator of sigma subunit)
MEVFQKIRRSWSQVRWKMLVIFAFLNIISTLLVVSCAAALLNVVIRRANASLVEEQINGVIDSWSHFTPVLFERTPCGTSASNSSVTQTYPTAPWPDGHISVTVAPRGAHAPMTAATWFDNGSLAGIVNDRGSLEIRASRSVEREGCSISVLVVIPLTESLLKLLSREVGLEISGSKTVPMQRYRAERGLLGEIEANFVPGSGRAIPVLVSARNLESGRSEVWTVCQLRPTFTRTVGDLSRMGLRKASWISPFGGIAFGLALVYAGGFLFSARLGHRIVAAIDGLSVAARRIGTGDFSVRLPVREQDQLGNLASSFNEMTRDLEILRENEKRNAVLERDIALAREVQEYLYPRTRPDLSGISVWGATTPARVLSGDLYDFLSFKDGKVGLLCADVSGKGLSAALMMSHLQAMAHDRLLSADGADRQPEPAAFVDGLNQGLRGRFGNSRYATMFYGELDSRRKVLRYINAGHCAPILISETGEVKALSGGDLPVGLFPHIRYQELQIDLSKGGTVIVYTDGVTDALNSEGEEFGEARLIGCCNSLPEGADARTIGRLLSENIALWTAGVEQFDDTTMLVLYVDRLQTPLSGSPRREGLSRSVIAEIS